MSTFESYVSQNTALKSGFLAKVFLFFGLAILTTAAGAYVGLNYFANLFLSTPAMMVMFVIQLIMIFSAKWWSKKAPLSYLMFAAFAFISGFTVVPLLGYVLAVTGSFNLILQALLATALMFSGAAIFGYTTNLNLQGMRGFLTLAVLGMVIVSIIGIFLPWGSTFEMIFAGVGVLVFSAYAMYDIQMIKNYPENAYIDAALQLYLDIFNLFIYIVRLILSLNRN